jgi:hypothetical protein
MDYKPMLFALIEEVIEKQLLPERISPRNSDVAADYGISRTRRRVYSTHVTNQAISDMDIQRLARWRSVENAGGKQADFGGTKEGYSDIMMMLKTPFRATRNL